jgi:hypothetical protein
MSWVCRCELCKDAFRQTLENYHWLDFLRHREDAVIRADMDDDVPVYLTELDNEIVVITEDLDEPKPALGIWCEEVRLSEFLRCCNVKPVEDERYFLNDVSECATII